MTREQFSELVKSKIVVLDGATGTNLQNAGMPTGVCPEQWILEHREVLLELQKAYVQAGTHILYTPTFSGNRIKLQEYGLEKKIGTINRLLVKLSKEAAGDKAYIAGDLTMTGEQLYPIGTLKFEQLVEVYEEQITYLLLEGVDLFVIETMMSLAECRAAVIAVKETCELPVMVTLSFREDGRTLYGTDPKTAILVLQSMGVDAVGINCSTGPNQMHEIVKEMKQFATVPIIVKPNAGLPQLVNGKSVFDMKVEEFAKEVVKLVEAGANIVGGCCGTTPQHIALLAKQVENRIPSSVHKKKIRAVTTERKTVEIHLNGRFMIVGERINPTGKKALQAELKEGNLESVRTMAKQQAEHGADMLDINMGMNGIDEKEMMIHALYEIMKCCDVPLCIDSSHVSVVEAALRIYPGRALINSISLEKEKFEKLIPIAKKYGAMFILLPLSDQGLPKNLEEKKEIIHMILQEALKQGLEKEDIIVDGLVNTIGANKKAALETMETIRYCKEELELATICGLSNISFGLPERQFVNSTFLAFAIQQGLTMAIANPSQDLLVNTAFASDLLLNKEKSDIRYIENVTNKSNLLSNVVNKNDILFESVITGNQSKIVELVIKTLEEGKKPSQIVDTYLIPAINKVGELFDKQIYFLPQLIASAQTMKRAIEYLEPFLSKDKEAIKLGTIVIATVAGDIHDIGKNLVALMLRNYGFEVIDLGKDVDTEVIIQTAKEKKADIIALSALMTTTMMEMKQVVKRAKEEQVSSLIIIGGAVITQSFADEIGANGYSTDAQDAVKLAKRLLNIE